MSTNKKLLSYKVFIFHLHIRCILVVTELFTVMYHTIFSCVIIMGLQHFVHMFICFPFYFCLRTVHRCTFLTLVSVNIKCKIAEKSKFVIAVKVCYSDLLASLCVSCGYPLFSSSSSITRSSLLVVVLYLFLSVKYSLSKTVCNVITLVTIYTPKQLDSYSAVVV